MLRAMQRKCGATGVDKLISRHHCPVACGHCVICRDHARFGSYQKEYAETGMCSLALEPSNSSQWPPAPPRYKQPPPAPLTPPQQQQQPRRQLAEASSPDLRSVLRELRSEIADVRLRMDRFESKLEGGIPRNGSLQGSLLPPTLITHGGSDALEPPWPPQPQPPPPPVVSPRLPAPPLVVANALTQSMSTDLVVYDATSGGVIAAVAAARHGVSVLLLCASWPACFEFGGHQVGGMSSSGLGMTDSCAPPEDAIGGLAYEFYQRNRRKYPNAVGVFNESAIDGGKQTKANKKKRLVARIQAHVAMAHPWIDGMPQGGLCVKRMRLETHAS